jgi:hypothetical protein
MSWVRRRRETEDGREVTTGDGLLAETSLSEERSP